MTKFAFILALGAASISAPVLAGHAHQGSTGYVPATYTSTSATDPCVLGTNTQPGACVGPVRVAPSILSQGAVQVERQAGYATAPTYAPNYAPAQTYAPQPTYRTQTVSSAQPAAVPPIPSPAPMSSGCMSNYSGGYVGCQGNWVAAPSYNTQSAPVQYAPAPVQYAPAPVQYAPAPVQYAPAPVQYAPAPMQVQYAPAPQYAPAVVQYVQAPRYAPQPQPVGLIQPSFFTGGITYGAGYPDGGSYYGGGGGGIIISGGGTRFSGVRERSPTPLIAPPMRQRHAPAPKPHHHCGHC